MRAAVCSGSGGFEVLEVPDPILAPDQVLVQVAACGICGSDIHMRESGLVFSGMIMGHELAGIVVGVGPEVEGVDEGTAVAVMPYLPCGRCDGCLRGLSEICFNQFRSAMGVGPRPGGLAERVAVWPGQLHPLPSGMPAHAGALAEPLAVGMHGVTRSGVTPSDRVVVMGGGSIGVMTSFALRALNVTDLLVSEPSSERREALQELGFTTVSPAELTAHAHGPAVVFDATGTGPALSDAVDVVRPGGTVMLLGFVEKPTTILPVRWLLKEVDVRTALAYGDSFPDAVAALGDGRVDSDTLAGVRVPLDEVEEAFSRLATAHAPPKILIEP